ncbi:glyoxalase-like domain protein [Burkholderia latens]|uniref:Glyoxalase-like domain protein n=1 Tax=Burkholderia latens TaxID=488446 RepID=A0A6P2NBN1_9BURK|nr:glyoxalase-like domain protein [Burkholderia latens]
MNVQLNHTIVWCRDKRASSRFLTELLELPPPTPFGAMLSSSSTTACRSISMSKAEKSPRSTTRF